MAQQQSEKGHTIDEDLYSRQLYALGRDAMRRMLGSVILVVGVTPCSTEAMKNIVLSGVGVIHVCDDTPVSARDIDDNFLFNDSHLAVPRSVAAASELQDFNRAVAVHPMQSSELAVEGIVGRHVGCILFQDQVTNFATAVLPLCDQLREWSAASGTPPIPTVVSNCLGLHGSIVVDVGPEFVVEDPTGEESGSSFASISIPGSDLSDVLAVVRDSVAGKAETGGLKEAVVVRVTLSGATGGAMGSDVATTAASMDQDALQQLQVGAVVSLRGLDSHVPVELRQIIQGMESVGPKEDALPQHVVQRVVKLGVFEIAVDLPEGMTADKLRTIIKTHQEGIVGLHTTPASESSVPARGTAAWSVLESQGYVTFVKQPEVVRHRPMSSLFPLCAQQPQYSSSLSAPEDIPHAFNFALDWELSHRALQLVLLFAAGEGRLPLPYSDCDWRIAEDVYIPRLVSATASCTSSTVTKDELGFFEKFIRTCGGAIQPMAAFVGGMASQEVLKAVSRKYIPVTQVWSFNALHVLPPGPMPEASPTQSSQQQLLGAELSKAMANWHVFCVGAGAIGCEYLKNFAVMGVGTGPKGKISVTDNDNIERSNLCRQLLFRDSHVGQNKAVVASKAVKAIRKRVKIRSLTTKVCDETLSEPFDERFWNSVSTICTAVDNMTAREFLDKMSYTHSKPMIDAGTLGAVGHVEVFVPSVTMRFSSSRSGNAAGNKIPFCTTHFFPTSIEHCVHYARDLFSGVFTNPALEVNKFFSAVDDGLMIGHPNHERELKTKDDVLEEWEATVDAGARRSVSGLLHTYIISLCPTSFAQCVQWACCKFYELFSTSIRDLLHTHPPGKKDEDGSPFWSKGRRLPVAVEQLMADSDELHFKFIKYAALLIAGMYKIDVPVRAGELDAAVIGIAASYLPPPYHPPAKPLDTSTEKGSNEAQDQGNSAKHVHQNQADPLGPELRQEVRDFMTEVFAHVKDRRDVSPAMPREGSAPKRPRSPTREGGAETSAEEPPAVPELPVPMELSVIEFEKDDPTNGHIEFISAVANLRARCYGIPGVPDSDAKRIAGRILPALVTTTAAVTGYACLEFVSVVAHGNVAVSTPEATEHHRNTNISVANINSTQFFEAQAAQPLVVFPDVGLDADGRRLRAAYMPDGDGADSPPMTCWSRFGILVADLEATSINDVIVAFATKYPPLQIVSLTAERGGMWVYNGLVGEGEANRTRGFPLVGWTRKLAPSEDLVPVGVKYVDYVVVCQAPDGRTVARTLPILRVRRAGVQR